MAVRYRKYFAVCKVVNCNGKQGRYCPSDRPKNALNGLWRKCGHWTVELFDDNHKWQSLVFKDVRSRVEAEKKAFTINRRQGAREIESIH